MPISKKNIRRCTYSRAVQALALAGLLVSGGATASLAYAAPLLNPTWGDITLDTSQTSTSTIGVWRYYSNWWSPSNKGNLTIGNGGSLTMSGKYADLIVGEGDLFIEKGGSLSLLGSKAVVGGNMVLADNASLIIDANGGRIHVAGNLTALGTVNGSTKGSMVIIGNMNWGNNSIDMGDETLTTLGNLTIGDGVFRDNLGVTQNLIANNIVHTFNDFTVEGNITANTVSASGASMRVGENLNVTGGAIFFFQRY